MKSKPTKHGGLPCAGKYDDSLRQLFNLIPSNGNGGPYYVRLEEEACKIRECAGE